MILVSIDTLRADHLPVYGYREIDTPVLTALAREAVVFEQAYTHVPLTLPAHASLFTGLLPFEHGVRDNVSFQLAAGHSTLAGELKQAGYRTGGAVSSFVLRAQTGIARGFDHYDDDMVPVGSRANATEIQRRGIETVQRALDWLAQPCSAPAEPCTGTPERLFLFVHLYEPHTPYTPPERHRRPGRAPYDGEVAYADEIVGRLFDGLRSLGLYDPSLILVLSDHGEALGQHGERDHGVFLYREVMRIPLMIKLPRGRNGGARVAAPVQLVDIAPTILDWIGRPSPPGASGRSLLPVLTGSGRLDDRRIYGESLYGSIHFGWQELFSLTDGRYSYILAPREELYDVERDPEQRHNLLAAGPESTAADHRTGLAKIHAALRENLLSQVHRPSSDGEFLVSDEEAASLQALGYLTSSVGRDGGNAARPDPKDRIGDLELYRQAKGLQRTHRYAMSVDKLKLAVAGSPLMVDAWDDLGASLQRLGRHEEAIAALRRSLDIDPRRPQRRLEVADLLVDLGRLDEARALIRDTTSLAAGEAYLRLALLEARNGQPEAARQAAVRAAETIPGARHFLAGVVLHGQGRYKEALQQLQQLAGSNAAPSDLSKMRHLHYYLGDSLAHESRASEGPARADLQRIAVRHLLEELARDPDAGAALIAVCSLYEAADRATECLPLVRRFMARNPSPMGYSTAASACTAAGLTAEAARWTAQARSNLDTPTRQR